jgi:hypothetical protein
LVVLFDVGGGYHTAVDIDLQMPVTLIATHHHSPPTCEEYGWRGPVSPGHVNRLVGDIGGALTKPGAPAVCPRWSTVSIPNSDGSNRRRPARPVEGVRRT